MICGWGGMVIPSNILSSCSFEISGTDFHP
jgi:hypothetical protein